MTKKEARALGRWCDKHQRKHERVAVAEGVTVTGCPVCLMSDQIRAAIEEWWRCLCSRPQC